MGSSYRKSSRGFADGSEWMVWKVHLPCCCHLVLLGLQYQKQPDSRQRQGVHLGGVLVEILQWWWVGWWFQVREVEDSHCQVLPSCCPNLDNSGQFFSLVDSRQRHGVP